MTFKNVAAVCCVGVLGVWALGACGSEDAPQTCANLTLDDESQFVCGEGIALRSLLEEAGENCPNGGQKLEFGTDDNANDRLDDDEVVGATYICNGADGVASGVLFNVVSEPMGANCEAGGIKLDIGIDNGDGDGVALDNVLQTGEVDSTQYLCNAPGEPGPTGEDGFSSLIAITAEAPGANCMFGGTRIEVGLDDGLPSGVARDGILQAGEVDQTQYICQATPPIASLVDVSAEPAGVNCSGGGTRIDAGLDDGEGLGVAGDTVLHADEVDQTFFVCHGEGAGPAVLTRVLPEAAGVNCSDGGTEVAVGLDDGIPGGVADDGILQDAEADSTAYACNGEAATDTLGNLTCIAGEIAAYDGTTWVCQAAPPSRPTGTCMGAFEVLQWDGSDWLCVNILATGASAGNAKGWETIDSWGLTWDGLERSTKTWTVADANCQAMGGRLPTLTELYRVGGNGTDEVGTSYTTNYLWSRTWWSKTEKGQIRLTDGGTLRRVLSSNEAYRCVWPQPALTYFADSSCYGPPGAECWTDVAQPRMNMDLYDRPAVSYVAANDECNYVHAHLAHFSDFEQNVPNGLPNGSNNWVWTSDAGQYDLNFVVRWLDTDPAFIGSGATYQSWVGRSGPSYRFRCKGAGYAAGSHPAAVASEFIASETTYLKASESVSTASTYGVATDACFSQGGHVGHDRDFLELAR